MSFLVEARNPIRLTHRKAQGLRITFGRPRCRPSLPRAEGIQPSGPRKPIRNLAPRASKMRGSRRYPFGVNRKVQVRNCSTLVKKRRPCKKASISRCSLCFDILGGHLTHFQGTPRIICLDSVSYLVNLKRLQDTKNHTPTSTFQRLLYPAKAFL